MKPTILRFVVFLAAAGYLEAASAEIRKFHDLAIGKKARFTIAVYNCFSGTGPRVEGTIKRVEKGWLLQCVEFPEAKGAKKKLKTVINEGIVNMWDDALLPKKYGEDDVMLTGAISTTVTWPDGVRTETWGSGDDNRILEALDAARKAQ